VVATVGALAIGRYLLEAAIKAWPLAEAPEAQLLVVCGASIDPKELPAPASERVRIVGFVDDLPAYLAAADLAIVQAGLTTVSECLALGTPMLCVPIKWHREQENNARYAERIGGAHTLERDQVTPARIAEEVAGMLRQRQAERQEAAVEGTPPSLTDGATRAAMHIERLLRNRTVRVETPEADLVGAA
jgi:zeaxanthin glucosyltransferase